MLRPFLRRALSRTEASLGVPVDYLRYVADHDPAALLKFGLLQPATAHRKVLPPEVYHAARIAATQAADCGTCVQVEVNAARASGVAPEAIRAVLAGEPLSVPEADAVSFARMTAGGEDPTEPRQRLRERFGDRGVVELALAVATAQAYPTIKRALGFATACSRVEVEV
ncbi:carboxymuconolactone decarboxylase family protein [Rubricoccus marinus]|uniref:Carboxymuconolactone decarboxylase-like domain-containing protein n=1 Tax=Rubricoccus marinus TaxID=716817 RepID=A0A259U1R9_9BACT|nr:carboxymuconolactone decarboxylase family protein [Rubricoccus marinus]OZC03764.1 hypothetical protein BSZ36_12690 [Rubricoccus marinus]